MANSSFQLQCMVTGVPKPAVYWSLEQQEGLIMPGTRKGNMYMAQDGSLKIENPTVDNSGHYTCTALNAVGSTLARSHVVIFDPQDFELEDPAPDHGRVYEDQGKDRLEEARLALMEKSIASLEAMPLSPTSIKVRYNHKRNLG